MLKIMPRLLHVTLNLFQGLLAKHTVRTTGDSGIRRNDDKEDYSFTIPSTFLIAQ